MEDTADSSDSLAEMMIQDYKKYKDAGFQWALFGPILPYTVLAIIGIPMNLTVCYVTIKYRRKNKSIGSKTGILIALISLFEILHQSSHFFAFYIAATGINFVPIWLAFLVNALPLFGFNCSLNMLTLSMDRLFGVMAPIYYHKMEKRPYVLCHLCLIFCYNLYIFASLFGPISHSPNWPVTGFIGDLFIGPDVSAIPSLFVPFALYTSVFLVYLIVGIIVKCRAATHNGNVHHSAHKLYRSIFLIVLFNVGGYFIGILFVVLVQSRIIEMLSYDSVACNLPGILLNVSAMSNGPILYLNSSEYRKAYVKEFSMIRRGISKSICRISPDSGNVVRATAAAVVQARKAGPKPIPVQ